MAEFSDYIVYVDESGDHDLSQKDSPYPIFCLSFCLFKKSDYADQIVPAFQKLKFKYFGDDTVILHERDIRRSLGAFAILRKDKALREGFLEDLTTLVSDTSVEIISTVIDKTKLKENYADPYSPYDIALHLCMERLYRSMKKKGQLDRRTSVIFECRGPKEDKELEVVFRRICANDNHWGYVKCDFEKSDFACRFVNKTANSSGLQIADLTARPIGMSILRPEQQNRAFAVISEKLTLKCFP